MLVKSEIMSGFTKEAKRSVIEQINEKRINGEELFSELGNRERNEVTLSRIAGKIVDASYDEDNDKLFITIDLIDTPMGKMAKDILLKDTALYGSSTLVKEHNSEKYAYIGTDIICEPNKNDPITNA